MDYEQAVEVFTKTVVFSACVSGAAVRLRILQHRDLPVSIFFGFRRWCFKWAALIYSFAVEVLIDARQFRYACR